MKMKQLLRYTTSLLRTALLIGAIILANIQQTQAQTAEEWAEMPDAFETMDPASIIGDGKYYYIQFYQAAHDQCSYLTDCGVNERARSKDFLPFANNRLWTLEAAGDDVTNHFKLRNKDGHYIQFGTFRGDGGDKPRVGCVDNFAAGSILTFHPIGNDGYHNGYYITAFNGGSETYPMYRPSYVEWAELAYNTSYSSSIADVFRLRFAKLKDNAAFIIYYRGEGIDNTNPGAETTRHYLTYSGTAESSLGNNWWSSSVSSQQSIIPNDMPLCTLPTVAAYHNDGLWTLEESDEEGQFYIKKYGTNQYLNEDEHWAGIYGSELGNKDATKGIYTLEDPLANRYTRIQNTNYVTEPLTANMFFEWNGYGANASKTSDTPTHVDVNFGDNAPQLNAGGTVYGDDYHVNYLKYANLTGYRKIYFKGTPDMQLRVLMNRVEPIPEGQEGRDPDGGTYLEKNVTIGSDGKAELDLKDLTLNTTITSQATVNMTYICGSDDAVDASYGDKTTEIVTGGYNNGYKWSTGPGSSISEVKLGEKSWGVNNIIYLKVDASAINGIITKVTLKADASGNGDRETEWGAGFNDLEWSPNMTWNSVDAAGGRNITDLTAVEDRPTVARNTTQQISLDITGAFTNDPDKIATILVYETRPGGGSFSNPTVEVEYYPSVPYAHLNSIKVGSGTGTISSIKLEKDEHRYLHRAQGDGWQVMQWGEDNNETNNYFYASFYPVEVPDLNQEPNQDKYYRVLAGFNDGYGVDGQMLTEFGWLANYSDADGERQLLFLSQEDDYQHFYLKTPDGQYIRPTGGTTDNKNEGERLTNTGLLAKFFLKWYYVNPVPRIIEIDVRPYKVKHKESYLRDYTTDSGESQGLIRDADSDWMKNGTQEVNEFKITHYIRRGNTRQMILPTTLRENNDHVFYQRWYIKGDEENLTRLQERVSLNVAGGKDVAYYIYKNGLVTGQKLQWNIPEYENVDKCVQYRFSYSNPDGAEGEIPITADVSRYSDLRYEGSSPYDGDLIEPSLTMRYIYYMNDAKSMAKRLMYFTGSNGWKEDKPIHFPVKRLSYETDKNEAYQGEFLSLRNLFRDYWVFDDPLFIKEYVYDEQNREYVGVIDYDYIRNKTEYNAEITQKYGEVTQATMDKFLDDHLISSVIYNDQGKESGKRIMITWGNNDANLALGGHKENNVAQGYYLYDEVYNKYQYGDSRFMVFNYPSSGQVTIPNGETEVSSELVAYFVDDRNTPDPEDDIKYQLCRYTIIFEKLSDPTIDNQTKTWSQIKGTNRDPNKLRDIAGPPIAKVTFDYPDRSADSETPDPDKNFYHTPQTGYTKHNNNSGLGPGSQIDKSSPIPLPFEKTNYAFDGADCSWGSYALISESETPYGYQNFVLPSNTLENKGNIGYAIEPDDGMQDGFMYIDASEMPGDICSVSFQGDFCADDKLMCTGWISGANKKNWEEADRDKRCPGGITLTMKGESEDGSTKTIYRFCPGQCYEVTSPYTYTKTINGQPVTKNTVEWQQFYFEFSTDKKYKRYWMEVNNNCISSNGGDFMLDNIEVYCIVPDVEPDVNTPLCISVSEDGKTVTDMRLLKLKINYNKLKSSRAVGADGTAEEGFVFLEKNKFLENFKAGLATLTYDEKQTLHLEGFNFNTITLDALANAIEKGELSSINMLSLAETDKAYIAYKDAFDSAILGKKSTWHSDDRDNVNTMNSSILYFRWSSTFENNTYQPPYSFADAVNKKHAVYREVEVVEGEKINYIVMNGNYPGLNWKTNVDYYVINTNQTFASGKPFTAFNLCSECCKASTFKIDPPYHVLGLESSETTDDYVVCEGQIPTIVLNLKGFDLNGNEVDMSGINYDWWLGDPTYTETDDDNNVIRPKLATLEHYHAQHKVINGVDVKLDKALSTFRTYYPSATSLEGLRHEVQHAPDPALTINMIDYLQELIDADELVLHQTSVSVPAEPVASDDSYFYMVACPIHDEMFDQALNPEENEYVSYYCDEPQGLRIKVGGKSPRLQTGFVPGEHGFQTYNYNFPANTNPVLSIRLAKAAQFETVKNTVEEVKVTNAETNEVTYTISEAPNYLWLPIRNAQTEGATGVIKKAKDDNVYLASSNDLTWDKKISAEMNKNGSLPIVGRIVQLTAVNTKNNSNADENGNNRLCVYFVKDFNVREGYNYTLSLPFQEDDNSNACDGTILINLKIVPDYEVWTGAAANPSDPTASNTDWNNDENWRRADGNTTINNSYYGDELYRANGAVDNEDSPLHTYTTNKDNYYSSSKKANAKPSSDQILRKGFAPLYCTHVLMKSDEWGNAPVLYDALDYKVEDTEHKLNDAPFPNLRETSTPILKFDMQARRWDMWNETYGENPDRGSSSRPNDLIAEMYQINSCDEIVFQPGTELRNAHLLNYNSAWMEYQLDNKRWYLLGSPLQGTISGEWYAPTGTAQQKTTYYDPVTFGTGYDRYSPAIYQRSWDKAKTVLYEIGSEYSTTDDSQTENLGYAWGGHWDGSNWKDPSEATDGTGADEYLDRLGYKPMGGNKANVAIKGIWSNTYNDAQVDYADGGFSVMVMNHLKGNDTSGDKAIIRLPKEDTKYFYFEYSEDGSRDDTNNTGDTKTDLSDVRTKDRAKNRGRLKADKLLPATVRVDNNDVEIRKTETAVSIYGDARNYTRIPIREDALQEMNNSFLPIVVDGNPQPPTAGLFTETVAAGISHLNYYLVENPFPCGLDMDKFFEANPRLEKKYWLLTASGQHLVQKGEENDEWISPTISTSDGDVFASANSILAPGQGFFVEATAPAEPVTSIAITFNKDMQTQSRFGVKDNENGMTFTIVVGQAQEMEPLKEKYDSNENGVIDEDDEERIVTIRVDTDGDGILDADETVMVPKYIDDPDNPGTKIPSLSDIEEDVVIYKYKQESLDATHNKEYPLLGRTRGEETEPSLQGLVITAQRDDNQSSALVMQRDEASNDFLPSEDTETFITSDLEHVPTVYTLCGRLATTINSIHDFRSLPIGVESNSDAPCTLTFKGVEMLGDSIAFYDALEQKLTPLKSGMTVSVSGQTQNRYYLVRSLIKEEAAAETHIQIFTEGLTAKVIASTGEPITSVRCYDTAGRLIHSASPQTPEYSFSLPIAGIYIISAETENDRKTIKLMAK